VIVRALPVNNRARIRTVAPSSPAVSVLISSDKIPAIRVAQGSKVVVSNPASRHRILTVVHSRAVATHLRR
jgi:hypothetical protein